jgi:hypothetical protein
MANKPENLSLSINLKEPKEKGKIIACIKSMPKCTHHEYPQLGDSSSVKRRSLVNTFSEPLLYCNIPMGNLVPDMFISFDHNRTAGVDKFEFISIVRNPAGMDARNTEFPSEVILEPNKGDTDK